MLNGQRQRLVGIMCALSDVWSKIINEECYCDRLSAARCSVIIGHIAYSGKCHSRRKVSIFDLERFKEIMIDLIGGNRKGISEYEVYLLVFSCLFLTVSLSSILNTTSRWIQIETFAFKNVWLNILKYIVLGNISI